MRAVRQIIVRTARCGFSASGLHIVRNLQPQPRHQEFEQGAGHHCRDHRHNDEHGKNLLRQKPGFQPDIEDDQLHQRPCVHQHAEQQRGMIAVAEQAADEGNRDNFTKDRHGDKDE